MCLIGDVTPRIMLSKLVSVFALFFFVFVLLPHAPKCRGQLVNPEVPRAMNAPWPPVRLGAPTQPISGEHISLEFYKTLAGADSCKRHLQHMLHNFLGNLQRNLTTSSILNTIVNTIDVGQTKHQLQKLHDLLTYFQSASQAAGTFADEAQHLFELTKNESNALLLKLRQVPTAQRFLPMHVKSQLTDYFAEMEYFHIVFSEIIDQALEYVVDMMRSLQHTFARYADVQSDVLHNWNFKRDEWCCNRYMDFLQQWSVEVFQCAAGKELTVAYDVYAMTEVTTRHALRQLEFRIQRLFNCFIFGSYEIRCRFLQQPEQDFEKLQAKLEELQIYFDIKIKKGRVDTYRHRRRRSDVEVEHEDVVTIDELEVLKNKCIPSGFPDNQMDSSLKACFYFPMFNEQ